MRAIVAACLLMLASMAAAVEPDEILDDPVLEARAREISKELRCLVCRNENIDSSNAGIAKDLRLLVRERLLEGDTDAQVIAYVVERYGEYVLLNPTGAGNRGLWLAGPIALLLGAGVVALRLRRRRDAEPKLNAAEEARLAELMQDHAAK